MSNDIIPIADVMEFKDLRVRIFLEKKRCVDRTVFVDRTNFVVLLLLDECRTFGREGEQFTGMNHFDQVETVGKMFTLDDRLEKRNQRLIPTEKYH